MGLFIDGIFVALLAVVTVTDLRERRIPNRVLAVGSTAGLSLLAVADAGSLPERLAVSLLIGGAFLALAYARPDGFGMGDAKLIAVMGLFLGQAVLAAVLVALCGGTLFGLALASAQGRAAASLTIPFAPFLTLGSLAALLGAIPLLQ